MGQPGGKGGTLQRDKHSGRAAGAGILELGIGQAGADSTAGWGVGRVGGCQSWFFQLDISNVEAAHVLVGALESPGDVLIHRAVIKIQALIEIFIFVVIWHVHSKLLILPPLPEEQQRPWHHCTEQQDDPFCRDDAVLGAFPHVQEGPRDLLAHSEVSATGTLYFFALYHLAPVQAPVALVNFGEDQLAHGTQARTQWHWGPCAVGLETEPPCDIRVLAVVLTGEDGLLTQVHRQGWWIPF